VWDEATENYKYDLDTGKYEISNGLTFQGEEAWPDVNITVLVNAECISAGDHLVNILSKFENVTIMGFTETNGSGQGISAIELESGSLTFSAVLMLNEDGSVFVDTDASRENAVKLDVKIPFDENAIKAIFDDGEDYILQQALK
jgi:carboxyl-terminal processing protease